MRETTLTELGLNVLTKEQYENAKQQEGFNNDALYFVLETEYDKGTVECYTRDLLWTNTNATTAGIAFASQTVNLDLTSYESIEVLFFTQAGNPYGSGIIKVEKGDKSYFMGNASNTNSTIVDGNNFVVDIRQVVCNADSVFFGPGFHTRNSDSWKYVSDNANAVPYKIYGIKKSTFAGLLDGTLQQRVETLEQHEVYSTSEQRIGTWIDGRTLYRRVINMPVSSTRDAWVHYDHGIEGIRTPVSIGGFYSGVQIPDKWTQLGFTTTQINYVIASNAGYSGSTAIIILEYTKTTD